MMINFCREFYGVHRMDSPLFTNFFFFTQKQRYSFIQIHNEYINRNNYISISLKTNKDESADRLTTFELIA
jgi:hypothetical protein